MIHYFKINGEYFLFDVENQSLLEIDKLVYDLLANSPTLFSDYSKSEIDEAQSEIDSLKNRGVIFSARPKGVVMPQKTDNIKSMCLHLSHDCNLRCKYCFAGTGTYHGERQNMPLEVAKKSIDFLIANSGAKKNLEIDFFGGEPLLNLDVLKETVEYAKVEAQKYNKTFKFTATTNGLLLNKEVADYLNSEMDNVVLSIDGRKNVNDLQRPTANEKGSFDLIIDKYKYFRSIRGDKDYYLRGTFTHLNPDFCEDVKFLAELGFDELSMEPVVLPEDHELALTETDLPAILESYEKLANYYVDARKDDSTWFSFFHFLLDLEDGPCYTKRLLGCGAGTEYVAVTPNGDVYPCHQFAGETDFLLGNVESNILDGNLRDKFRNSNLETKIGCNDCFAKYHCSGGCAANAVHFSGDINKPYEYACKLMRKRLECALFVYAKEHKNN